MYKTELGDAWIVGYCSLIFNTVKQSAANILLLSTIKCSISSSIWYFSCCISVWKSNNRMRIVVSVPNMLQADLTILLSYISFGFNVKQLVCRQVTLAGFNFQTIYEIYNNCPLTWQGFSFCQVPTLFSWSNLRDQNSKPNQIVVQIKIFA